MINKNKIPSKEIKDQVEYLISEFEMKMKNPLNNGSIIFGFYENLMTLKSTIDNSKGDSYFFVDDNGYKGTHIEELSIIESYIQALK